MLATCLILYSKISIQLLTNLVNPCTSLFESFCQPISLRIVKSKNDSFKNWVFYVPLDGTVIIYKSGRGLAQAVILGCNSFLSRLGCRLFDHGYSRVSKSLQENAALSFQLLHDRFIPNSIQLNKS